MNSASERLSAALERAEPMLFAFSDEEASARPGSNDWSPKEIIGHLIDSASNNHQRFVRAQLSDDLLFLGYDQEGWVSVQRYRERPWASLVTLWSEYNLHLVRVIVGVPDEARYKPRLIHNLDQIAWKVVPKEEPTTLEYFMSDYVGHLENHLKQIFPNWSDHE
jgi:hypothetical protein